MNNIERNMEEIEVALGYKKEFTTKAGGTSEFLSPSWFKSKEPLYKTFEIDADKYSILFNEKYGPDALKSIDHNYLASKVFLGKDEDNLCHELEYQKESKLLFSGIGGGSAYSYPCFYKSSVQSWVCGSARKNKNISEEEANEIAEETIKKLIDGCNVITSWKDKLLDLSSYEKLYIDLVEKIGALADKQWVMKYFTIIFSDLFSPFYSDEWQKKALNVLKRDNDDNKYIQNGTITLVAKEASISPIVFSRIIYDLIDGKFKEEAKSQTTNETHQFDYISSSIRDGVNLIVYGTPGCGKSYYVKHTLLKDYPEDNIFRTTFFADYTNTDFVGQILPLVEGERVTYKFNPGPFTLALAQAIRKPNERVALVIEELNRGSAPSIFGDIFQLLDRNNGVSEYPIKNINIIDYLNEEFDGQYIFKEVKIPSNLFIYATMNTSDQNVFTLDTAFKRRWEFKKLINDFKDDHKFKDDYIPGADVTWQQLVTGINDYMLSLTDGYNNEDKQIGVYFVDETGMRKDKVDTSNKEEREKFAYKVLEYLWDDVSKFDRKSWFDENIKSLDELVEEYTEKGIEVFNGNLKDKIKK